MDRPVPKMAHRFLATFPDLIVVGLAATVPEALARPSR
jgi:hypothetical protein